MVKIHTLNKLKLLNYKLRISFANSRSSKHFSIVLPHLTNTHIQYKLDDKMLTQKREESRYEMEGQKSFLKISILRKTKKSKPLRNKKYEEYTKAHYISKNLFQYANWVYWSPFLWTKDHLLLLATLEKTPIRVNEIC